MDLRQKVEAQRSRLVNLTPNKGWREICDAIYKEAMYAVNRLEWLEFRYEGKELPRANLNHPEHPEVVPRGFQGNAIPRPALDWAGAEHEVVDIDPEPPQAGEEPIKPENLLGRDYIDLEEEEQEQWDMWDRDWINWNDMENEHRAWRARHAAPAAAQVNAIRVNQDAAVAQTPPAAEVLVNGVGQLLDWNRRQADAWAVETAVWRTQVAAAAVDTPLPPPTPPPQPPMNRAARDALNRLDGILRNPPRPPRGAR